MGAALTKATLLLLGYQSFVSDHLYHVEAFRSNSKNCSFGVLYSSLPGSIRRQRCHGTDDADKHNRADGSRLYLNFNNFSDNSVKVLMLSQEEARQASASQIATRHIFQGLVCLESGLASRILREFNVTVKKAREAGKAENQQQRMAASTNKTDVTSLTFSDDAKQALEQSSIEAERLGQSYIETEHILLGVLHSKSEDMVQLMSSLSLDKDTVQKATMKHIAQQKQQNEEQSPQDVWKHTLNQYSYIPAQGRNMELLKDGYTASPLNAFTVDITSKAEEGKLPKVLCRDVEIDRAIRTLCRKHKRNPILIGEPGVGKTAVVEGLAMELLNDDVMPCLMNKRIRQLDVGLLVAGSRFRGQFEERLTKLIDELKTMKDVILVIDEAHMLVGAGAGDGALDAANLLKPSLSRGEIQCIAITTPKEYRKYFEKDAALSRRFQPIYVNEPSEEQTKKILYATTESYGKFHKVKYTDEAVMAAMKYSKQFIPDRFLPDKAIDILDEAGSLAKIRYYENNVLPNISAEDQDSEELSTDIDDIDVRPGDIPELGKEDNSILRQFMAHEKYLESQNAPNINEFDSEDDSDQDDDYSTDMLSDAEDYLENKKSNKVLCEVSPEHVAEVVSTMTGVPLKKLSEDELSAIRNMEEEIHKSIIGQEEAVTHICKAIRRAKANIKNPDRPIGSFLFCGPPGVGKSEISRALTRFLFAKENLIKLDMSEYNEPHSISRILGSPPGYKGHDAGGQLTDKLRKNPYSVVMFDEIEKAHHDVLNVLLQILEDGKLTDSRNQVVSFKNAVIIMTSNIGSNVIERASRGVHSFGFNVEASSSSEEENYAKLKGLVQEELKSQFKAELINRIDDVILFMPLKEQEMKQIAKLMIDVVVKRATEAGVNVVVEESFVDYVLKLPRDDKSGARPLRRLITSHLEDKLTDLIISPDYMPGKEYRVTVDENSQVVIREATGEEKTQAAPATPPQADIIATREPVYDSLSALTNLEEVDV
ncbi:ATP-dependent CLP protease [Babesia gibsoni]|uniref:ATP-dependent CLP protease n=1 Tax=Babesia gibsoni TaxID=33632 RepID=A0AAD8PGV9_BABGI|nr:ATP-dependent CLP protease [Babesia gibsoni]